jgi:hypothetical protein
MDEVTWSGCNSSYTFMTHVIQFLMAMLDTLAPQAAMTVTVSLHHSPRYMAHVYTMCS